MTAAATLIILWEPTGRHSEPWSEGDLLTHEQARKEIEYYREDFEVKKVIDAYSLDDVTDAFRPAPTAADRKAAAVDREIKDMKLEAA